MITVAEDAKCTSEDLVVILGTVIKLSTNVVFFCNCRDFVTFHGHFVVFLVSVSIIRNFRACLKKLTIYFYKGRIAEMIFHDISLVSDLWFTLCSCKAIISC